LVSLNRELCLFIKGGLGNQLFQLAATLQTAQTFNLGVVLHTTYLPLAEDKFRGVSRWPLAFSWIPEAIQIANSRNQPTNSTSLSSKIVTTLFAARKFLNKVQRKWQYVSEAEILSTDFSDMRTDKYFLSGIFGYGELLFNQQNQMRKIVEESALRNAFPKVLDEDIAVHVRLGDKAPRKPEEYHELSRYFSNAVKSFGLDANARIRVFSDNPVLASKLLVSSSVKNLVHAPIELDAISTLALLGSHKYIVGSASSFSWWASFLQVQGFTVLPRRSEPKLEKRNLVLAHHDFV
jgi:hypothetical protein